LENYALLAVGYADAVGFAGNVRSNGLTELMVFPIGHSLSIAAPHHEDCEIGFPLACAGVWACGAWLSGGACAEPGVSGGWGLPGTGNVEGVFPRDLCPGCGAFAEGMDGVGADGGGPANVVVGLGSVGYFRGTGVFASKQFPAGVPGGLRDLAVEIPGAATGGGFVTRFGPEARGTRGSF
jgi:hypothetical protein